MAKKTVSLSVEEEVYEEYRKYCEEKGMKMSNEVEKLIKEDIE